MKVKRQKKKDIHYTNYHKKLWKGEYSCNEKTKKENKKDNKNKDFSLYYHSVNNISNGNFRINKNKEV